MSGVFLHKNFSFSSKCIIVLFRSLSESLTKAGATQNSLETKRKEKMWFLIFLLELTKVAAYVVTAATSKFSEIPGKKCFLVP